MNKAVNGILKQYHMHMINEKNSLAWYQRIIKDITWSIEHKTGMEKSYIGALQQAIEERKAHCDAIINLLEKGTKLEESTKGDKNNGKN